MRTPKDSALEALRKILLQEDQLKIRQLENEISALKKQIANKESIIASLDPILIDLLERKISYSKEEMAEALAPIMGDAIKHQISEAKDDVVDALYPIIGRTIRKSVAEAMKKLVDSINQKIDLALRKSFFKRHIQSKITGIPEGELILKDAMPFRIQEMFLIHKENGLLLSHVSSREADIKVAEDLISGMLTAIRNFVSEAFKGGESQELNEIQYGDSKILLEMGPYFYLAIVISGIEPTPFKNDIYSLGRKIHNRYYKPLRQFDGDITQFGEISKLLDSYIQKYNRQPEVKTPQKTRSYLPYLLAGMLLISLLVLAINKVPRYLAYQKIQNEIQAKIEAIPELRQQAITYKLSKESLTILGTVNSVQQKAKVESLVHTVAEIRNIDNRLSLKNIDIYAHEIIHQIRQRMSQSADLRDLNPNIIVEDKQIILEGSVPSLKAKRDLGYLASEISAVKVVINNLEVHKNIEFSIEDMKRLLRDKIICFEADNAAIPEREFKKLDSICHYIKNLENMKLIIRGFSDIVADSTYNLRLSEQRARSVSAYIRSKGVPDSNMVIEYYGERYAIASNETEEGRAQNRRVEFDIIRKR